MISLDAALEAIRFSEEQKTDQRKNNRLRILSQRRKNKQRKYRKTQTYKKTMKQYQESKKGQRNKQNQWLKKRNKRLTAMKKIGSLKCVYCGCDDIRTLQINHKNCDGQKDRNTTLHKKIINGERDTKDLEITCQICNWRHYLTHKYGINNWTITWNTPQ